MTRIYAESFDSFADGAVLTQANTAFTNVSGSGSFTARSTLGKSNGCAELQCTAQDRYLVRDITATNRIYLRFYVRPDSTINSGRPTSNLVMARFYTGGTTRASLVWNTGGNFKIQNSGSIIVGANTTTALPTNVWSRVEFGIDGANVSLRVYPGDQVDATGTPAIAGNAQSGTHGAGATPGVNSVWMGALGSNTVRYRLDEIDTDDTTWVGPLVATPTTAPHWYYDTGSAWVDVSGDVHYDNGTAWVQV